MVAGAGPHEVMTVTPLVVVSPVAVTVIVVVLCGPGAPVYVTSGGPKPGLDGAARLKFCQAVVLSHGQTVTVRVLVTLIEVTVDVWLLLEALVEVKEETVVDELLDAGAELVDDGTTELVLLPDEFDEDGLAVELVADDDTTEVVLLVLVELDED